MTSIKIATTRVFASSTIAPRFTDDDKTRPNREKTVIVHIKVTRSLSKDRSKSEWRRPQIREFIFPPRKLPRKSANGERFPSFIFISLSDRARIFIDDVGKARARPRSEPSKRGFDSISPGNLSPVESSSSRGRAAIKGGHNCFQVVETLGPRKILSETVFQLLASRLGEISRKRMCIQRLCIEIVVTRAARVPGERV